MAKRVVTITALITGESILESFTAGQVLGRFWTTMNVVQKEMNYWAEAEHAAYAVRNQELSSPSNFGITVWDIYQDLDSPEPFARAVFEAAE